MTLTRDLQLFPKHGKMKQRSKLVRKHENVEKHKIDMMITYINKELCDRGNKTVTHDSISTIKDNATWNVYTNVVNL